MTSPWGAVSYADEEATTADPVRVEPLARGAQRGQPVALIGAEAEVAPHRSGREGQRSRQTSTATSSTGSGMGGSGLAARTRTESAP